MLKLFNKRTTLILGCILSIFLGALIYAVFRKETYVSQIILSFADLSKIKDAVGWAECEFVKYYFPDYLWAFSLDCGVLFILNPTSRRATISCSALTILFGSLYEILQGVNVIKGTGDIIDVVMYFLAVLIIYLFYKKGMSK